jgi:hypothetical protein
LTDGNDWQAQEAFMRIAAVLFSALLSLSLSACSPPLTQGKGLIPKDAAALPLHIGGRVLKEADGYAHQWPGVYFEARFSGNSLLAHFNDPTGRYKLSIDDGPPTHINRPGVTDYRLSGLGQGQHHVRLEKTSESFHETGRFGGFYVPQAKSVLPAPEPHTRQIEFIGDSYTSGFANTLNQHKCDDGDAERAGDTSLTFGPLIAHHYKADYQINAYSGIGVVRNYSAMRDVPVIPELYENTLFSPPTYERAGWHPPIIIIALGGNDYSEPFTPDARWKTVKDIRPDFITGYVTFIKRVRQLNPTATLIVMQFGDGRAYGNPHTVEDDTEVVRRLRADGDTRIMLYNTGGHLQQTACYSHLNLEDNRRVAAGLISYIDAHPDFWQGQ